MLFRKDLNYSMNKAVFSFVVYLIHELADSWKMLPSRVFHILKESGCIDNYLIPYFDVLHTLGSQYLVRDITEYVEKRGVTL